MSDISPGETVQSETMATADTPPPPSAAPARPARVPLKANPVEYDGRAGKIFGLMLVNFLLTIVTLGIYSFWGKTRLRRYLLGSVSINNGERLKYTGTAMELLVGWLKAVVCIFPIALVLGWAGETGHYIVYFVFLTALYALVYLGTYLALRYRLSRATWRNIRFGLQGKGMVYMKLSIVRLAMNVCTLGYLIPASDIKKWEYMGGNMNFGKRMFSYKGDSSKLIVTNLITLWVPLLPLLLVAASSWGDLAAFYEYSKAVKVNPNVQPNPEIMDGFIATLLTFYGVLFVGFLMRLWYRAALRAERLRGLKLGHLRFRSTATGMGYFKLKLMNVIIMVFTLGLGFAIVKNRNMKFESTTIIVGGDLEQMIADQANPNTKSDVGDALAPDMDMGAAVSIGI